MGNKYRERTIAVNGKMYFVQYFGDSNFFYWLLALVFAMLLWTQLVLLFNMPNEIDFNSDTYREAARKTATDRLIDIEKIVWLKRGFVEKNFTPKTIRIDAKRLDKDIAEMSKYLGNGLYEIYTGTDASLSTTSEDGKTTKHGVFSVNKECIITIKSTPERNWYGTVNLNWRIIDIRYVKSYPEESYIEKMIQNWKVPPSKKPDW